MNVLSLFDGISCGQVALDRAGIKVDNYFASEVDKHAIKVTMKNYPNTIQLGDVRNVKGSDLPKIDLFMSGSPCQGFSFAGKQLNFDDPRSKLFFEYVRIGHEVVPDYWLLENVRMKKESQDVITGLLGYDPIMINSSLVSAQNRVRLYWTNIPDVGQPEDKGLLLKDIIEENFNGIYTIPRGFNKGGCNGNTKKSPTLGASSWEHNNFVEFVDRDKSYCIDANYWKGGNYKSYFEKGKRQLVFKEGCNQAGEAYDINGHDFLKRIYGTDGKCPTLTAVCEGNQERKIATDNLSYRRLTCLECERLQTLPDGYTEGISNSQRYKAIGNGWTIDVIVHILKNYKSLELL